MKRYSCYNYKVFYNTGSLSEHEHWKGWVYEIYDPSTNELIRESDEWFDTEAEAEFAAIGHISLLENGEG